MSVSSRIWHIHPTNTFVFPVAYTLGPCICIKITTRLWMFHYRDCEAHVCKHPNLPTTDWRKEFDYLLAEETHRYADTLSVFGVDSLAIGGTKSAFVINAYGQKRDGAPMSHLYGMEIHCAAQQMGAGDFMIHPEIEISDCPM